MSKYLSGVQKGTSVAGTITDRLYGHPYDALNQQFKEPSHNGPYRRTTFLVKVCVSILEMSGSIHYVDTSVGVRLDHLLVQSMCIK